MLSDYKNHLASLHHRVTSHFTVFLCVLVMVSCGKDSPTNPKPPPEPPPPPPVTLVPSRITITPAQSTLNAIGQTVQLSAVVFDQNGNSLTTAVTWKSGNVTVASVSATGRVTAMATGSTTITAEAGEASATATVTVSPAASRITLSPETPVLDAIDQTVQLSAAAFDRNDHPITDPVVNWTSSDPSVANVSTKGLVTSRMNGTTDITAASGNATASTVVTVSPGTGTYRGRAGFDDF